MFLTSFNRYSIIFVCICYFEYCRLGLMKNMQCFTFTPKWTRPRQLYGLQGETGSTISGITIISLQRIQTAYSGQPTRTLGKSRYSHQSLDIVASYPFGHGATLTMQWNFILNYFPCIINVDGLQFAFKSKFSIQRILFFIYSFIILKMYLNKIFINIYFIKRRYFSREFKLPITLIDKVNCDAESIIASSMSVVLN